MTTMTKTEIKGSLDTRVLQRILDEGYGPGAWHGDDLKAAVADVSPQLAFWRSSPARHNIAEIAIHHAFYAHDVQRRLGAQPGPFVLEGEDWFPLEADGRPLAWSKILDVVAREQERLFEVVGQLSATSGGSSTADRLDLVLGITCHAVYHAGQIQLLKKLAEEKKVK